MWLEQNDLGFLFGVGLVLYPAWDNIKLARPKSYNTVSKADLKKSAMHKKQFIFIRVSMPDELAFELAASDLLAIKLCNDVWIPMGSDGGKSLCQVD